jgi:uncharacterized membrane protein YeaQ/YmgE (transglycosylase-associated protein family)
MVREHSLTTDLVVGVVGALVGMFVAEILGVARGGFVGSLIISTLGATVLIFTVGMIRSRQTLSHSKPEE